MYGLADHVDVHDSILFVGRGHCREAKTRVKLLEPTLCRELDLLAGREHLQPSQGLGHESSTYAGPSHLLRCRNTPDRSLRVANSGLEHSGVGDESALGGPLVPAE